MKVAVVGSGVSGLAATWLLNEHSDHEVHLYESDYRPGGHANTVHFLPKGSPWRKGVDVDTGFIVFNPSTHPNFLRFLKMNAPKPSKASLFSKWRAQEPIAVPDDEQGIRILPTEMTFSVSRDGGRFEWAGKNLFTIFCQPKRLLDPGMWRMIYDILRFNATATRFLFDTERKADFSIGDYLVEGGYSNSFRDNYILPMTAAIWSTLPNKCALDFPARTLIQFMYNHHLLQIIGKPSWLTIQGGSHHYVRRILSRLPIEQLHLSTAVTSLKSLLGVGPHPSNWDKPKIVLTTADGNQQIYDHVILACHSDSALKILRNGGMEDEGGITVDEERILGMFDWNRNEVVLHHAVRLMPRNRSAWSCWNYLTESVESDEPTQDSIEKSDSDLKAGDKFDRVSLTYGMNDLQHISEKQHGPVLATLNPPFEPSPDKVVGRWQHDHPVLNANAILAQQEIHKIQNKRSISFAGAYLKYGFHEDGFTSGLIAACSMESDVFSDESPPSYESLSESSESYISTTRLIVPGMTSTTTFVRATPTTGPFKHEGSVRPPFPIKHADHHLRLTISSVDGFIARAFEWLERSGVRAFVGLVGTMVLGVMGMVLGVNVDFQVDGTKEC